ncbi:MAG: type II toxin-antitoxin system RelE/ParE family toxin [Candidatus Methanosuratincola petrocarbonis]
MSYQVLLHPSAAKELEKIDSRERVRILERLRELRDEPKIGKTLRHSSFWSLRAGDYRAIYEIDWESRRVIVLFIGHRSSVYEDFSKLF